MFLTTLIIEELSRGLASLRLSACALRAEMLQQVTGKFGTQQTEQAAQTSHPVSMHPINKL